MATLSGQRIQFTWALNEYNKTDDPVQRARFVRHMAVAIRNSLDAGFTRDQVTREKSYPAEEVDKALVDANIGSEVPVTEAQAQELQSQNSVVFNNVKRRGTGEETVYAYGYKCAPDRIKIGCTTGDTVARIAAQIGTSTPDKPVLYLEVRTTRCRALERALHTVLDYRGKKVAGGGDEWFLTTVSEIEGLIDFIETSPFL